MDTITKAIVDSSIAIIFIITGIVIIAGMVVGIIDGGIRAIIITAIVVIIFVVIAADSIFEIREGKLLE